MWTMFRRKKVEKPVLEARVQQLELAFDEYATQFNRLAVQHQKLSGSFYQRFGKGELPPQRPTAVASSKDELRRQAGIVPGRPVQHNEG